MSEFVLDLPDTRTRFGAGCTATLREEIKQSGGGKALVVCTEGGARRYRQLIDDLGVHCVAVFDKAMPHCPADTAMAALRSFILSEASCVVAIGGGSTLGLGKFITVNTGKPWFAVPTTFSGSEITSLSGIKIDSEKRTRKNPACRAKVVFYDSALAATLPVHETVTTGMNCLAHCIEALYPSVPNPLSASLAIEGAAILRRTLPVCVSSPSDLDARQEALYAGFLGGLMVEMVGIGMHHKICHVIGGHYDIAHADSNSAVLPHVIAFNQAAIGKSGFDLATALGAKDAGSGVYALAKALEAPLSLQQLGVDKEKLPVMAAESAKHIQHNPRPFTEKDVLGILEKAWHGLPP